MATVSQPLGLWSLIQAHHVLQAGGVIAYPTEAVWGLGCDPYNEAALDRILQIKQRDMAKGMLLVASDIEQIEYLLGGVTAEQRAKMAASWQAGQRPTTWLVPHRGLVPSLVHGRFDTVAVRVSQHQGIQALCEQFGGPIVSTSANFSGHPAATNPLQVRKFLGAHLDFIVPGELGGAAKPSRIIDAVTDRVIRD